MFPLSRVLRVAAAVLALVAIFGAQQAESKKLLKLAAAAAIIRGGPIIPLPIRYPVHVPKPHVKYVHSAPIVKHVEHHGGWDHGGWDHGWEGGHGGWEGGHGGWW